MWAPLATGLAVARSGSTTQMADFLRRTVDLVALIVSWYTFRYISHKAEQDAAEQKRLEHTAGLVVAAALILSGVVTVALSAGKLGSVPSGNVGLGLMIATLGGITNVYFWWKYSALLREQHNTVIDAQRQLYRAKSAMDMCVVVVLATVALFPLRPFVGVVDSLGSGTVGIYMIWSGVRLLRVTATGLREARQYQN